MPVVRSVRAALYGGTPCPTAVRCQPRPFSMTAEGLYDGLEWLGRARASPDCIGASRTPASRLRRAIKHASQVS